MGGMTVRVIIVVMTLRISFVIFRMAIVAVVLLALMVFMNSRQFMASIGNIYKFMVLMMTFVIM
ncbi:hypothetical protein CCACVL1_07933 [Corchorus capsularis]|uniref:Uncharacterized protein n=1 Tax=Corchorus capsularis TaxID=210143 RepID=A0A1R3J389_COCAP|nr:hypothetical protein CCACVL1_07933 [Corchorus capsularis]